MIQARDRPHPAAQDRLRGTLVGFKTQEGATRGGGLGFWGYQSEIAKVRAESE